MDPISEVVAVARAGRAVAVRNRYAGAWSTRFPAVNGSGLHVVQQGSPWLVPETGDPVLLHAGDVVFLPQGRPHGFSHEPALFADLPDVNGRTPELEVFDVQFVSCCYHLDAGQVHEALAGLPDVVTLTIDGDSDPTMRTLADLLGDHATDDRPGNDIALPAIVDLLLVHLLRAWREQQGGPAQHGAPDPEIARVLRAVHADASRPWTLQQLSDLAGLSRVTFARRFTRVVGETPGAYLGRRRLEHGTHLLRHTQQPLASIARQLGYSTEFSFSAAFRRRFGVAPGRFRHRERQGP